MNSQTTELDSQLQELLERQTDEYESAQNVLQQFVDAVRDPGTVTNWTSELSSVLESFRTVEADVVSCRNAWLAAGRRPSVGLQDAVTRQQQMVEQLIRRIAVIEQEINTRRQRLAPELDTAAVVQRMHTAYARGSGRS